MLNPLWLQTFKVLTETGHFTRTAEQLHMTQPGVSQHIQKLEDACGHNLLQREKKSFQLTEQGRQVYEYACLLATQEQQLFEQLSFDDPYSGDYQLACSGSLALALYPRLLELQQTYPQLCPHLEVAPNQTILSRISNGHSDLGIVTLVPDPQLVDVQPLGEESLCLILPATTTADSHLSAQLQQLGLIDHPDAAHYMRLYFDHCGDAELQTLQHQDFRTQGYINQLSQILLPVAAGHGFTLLPRSAVNSFSQPELLQIHQPVQPVSETLYLVSRRNRALPARLQTVIEALHRHFQTAT